MTPSQIKTVRKTHKLSAREFGEMMGLTGKKKELTVYRWENGTRNPSGPVLKLMEQLNTKVAK